MPWRPAKTCSALTARSATPICSPPSNSTRTASPNGGLCSTSFRPSLTNESSTGDDLIEYVIQYRDVLDQLDESLDESFPLWDVVARFDNEQKLKEELAKHEERTGVSKPKDATEAKPKSAAEAAEAKLQDALKVKPKRQRSQAKAVGLRPFRGCLLVIQLAIVAGFALAVSSYLAQLRARFSRGRLRLRYASHPGRYNPMRPTSCTS